MKKIQINLLDIDNPSRSPRAAFQTASSQLVLFPKTILVFFSFLLLFTVATTALSYQSVKNEQSPLNKTFNAIVSFGPFNHLVTGVDRRLSGEHDDRVNILLLGIGGKGHEGTHLTDTVLIASIKPSTKQAALFSIPRDLLIPLEGYGWRKINNANAFGEVANPGYGPEFAKKTISDLFQIPLQYYARVDFKAFEELIDRVDGIHVCVEKSFTDYTYPTLDEKYQTLSFKAGCQDMDGDHALKFVRSRHSLMNNEGSDFARSKRQQKVLTAVKEKVFTAGVLLNPGKISDILQAYQENVVTNLKPWEIIKLANVVRKFDDTHIQNVVFDDGVDGYLVASTAEGAYVLQPRDGTYDAMRKKIQGIFEETNNIQSADATQSATLPTTSVRSGIRITEHTNSSTTNSKEAPISVGILNGTTREGLATRGAAFLRNKGYAIKSVGNALTRDYVQNVLVDNTNGTKKEELKSLQSLFNAEIKAVGEVLSTADFTLILGNEATQ